MKKLRKSKTEREILGLSGSEEVLGRNGNNHLTIKNKVSGKKNVIPRTCPSVHTLQNVVHQLKKINSAPH